MQFRFIAPLAAVAMIAGAPAFAKSTAAADKPAKVKHVKKTKTTHTATTSADGAK